MPADVRIRAMQTNSYVPDHEIVRLARDFVKQHGPTAVELVARKEREILGAGDIPGAGICRRLLREIERLLALEPASLLIH